jgi:DNA-binding response OmpR family regulator
MAADSATPARVLVVDDEPNIVDVITMALRYQGFEAASAATGQEALAAVESFRPQVMILDVMLPDMEGFEVAERLGAERGLVPILFLTARDATEDKLRGLTTGGDDYMTKPFSLEELVARIRVILRRTGGGATGRWRGRRPCSRPRPPGCAPKRPAARGRGPSRSAPAAPRWGGPRRAPRRSAGSRRCSRCRR